MAGLIGDILSNTRALSNQSAALELTGKNLSNVNNTAYARQKLATTNVSGPGGVSYDYTRVQSQRDAVLDRSVVAEAGNTGRLDELQRLYTQLNRVTGEQIDGTTGSSLANATAETSGLSGSLTAFFNAWQAFSASPNDASAKEVLFQSADDLTTQLNGANSALDDAQADLDTRLGTQVDATNSVLEQISTLNAQIVRQEARAPGSASELRDSRQQALEKLGGYMDFTSESQPDGSVTLSLADGTALVANGAYNPISVTRDATGTATGLQVDAASGSTAFTPAKGSLSVLHPSNGAAQVEAFRGELDSLAGQLSEQVNIAYGAAGKGGFFSGTTAASISLAVAKPADLAAASAGQPAGSNDVASAVAALGSDVFATGSGDLIDGTFTGFATQVATRHAADLSSVQQQSQQEDTVATMLRTQRDNVTGVSMDEEVADMMRLQKAFQASARVVNTVNQLLDIVTTRLGV